MHLIKVAMDPKEMEALAEHSMSNSDDDVNEIDRSDFLKMRTPKKHRAHKPRDPMGDPFIHCSKCRLNNNPEEEFKGSVSALDPAVTPEVDNNMVLHAWFMTSIESRGVHKSGERCKHEGHEGFRQVRASMRITTLRPVFSCILICWIETPSTPPFICQVGVGFTRKI
jgi:hypothetical protein